MTFGKMAGWISEPESDDEPLNLKMFGRKSFAFQGFSKEKEDVLKKIVQQMGGVCDDFPKYVLTNKQYYSSLDSLYTKSYGTMYNVTYLRDCIDANRCLNIEQYRFGSKHPDKQDPKEFEPCCQYFHNEQDSCKVCDPFLMPEVEKSKKRTKSLLNESENGNVVIKSGSKSISNSTSKKENINSSRVKKRKFTKGPFIIWEQWELRLMLDYAISKNLLYWVKSPSFFKRMHEDGFLKHRTIDAMRGNFRESILKNLKAFDLPEPIYRKLKQIKEATFPGRAASKTLNNKSKKNIFKQKYKFQQIKNVKL